jgi:protein-disulfide isomerase
MNTTPLSSQPEDTLPVRRSSLGSILFLILGFAAGLAVGFFNWGTQPKALDESVANPGAVVAQAPQRVNVPIGTAPVWGPTTAAVTIVEFSDYECPYCQKWHKEVWPQIQQAYPNQVRLVYKDFPLQGHPNASPAALAARCANDQNKYWLFHDRLFSGKALSSAYFESIATELSLNVATWKACLTSNKYNKEIEADYNYGADLGITGTPTFFINGVALVGAQPFSAFKKVIDQELAAVK